MGDCMSGPCTIAIADDVEDIRQMMRFWLDAIGGEFEVVGEAADGEQAVAVARKTKPQAMILDLSMPKMDGLQAIPEIRKYSPRTKILVLSGFDAGSMSRRAITLGAHAYVEKGTSFSQLTDILRNLCAA
ncbi:MAG: response regulator transcription factor [Actinomycetota bacterium]